MRWLGLELEDAQLDWGSGTQHDVGGNPMRFRRQSGIAPDEAWQQELGPGPRLLVSIGLLRAWLRRDAAERDGSSAP